jgi:glycosyltransferase involved in cell wall biosynthesis
LKRKEGFLIFAAVGALIAVIVMILAPKHSTILYEMTMSPLKSVFEGVDCNGKGIRLGGSCICDLGFRGSNCALTYDMTRPAGTVRELSVLLVVENFSPIDVERDNAIYYTTLAGFLARSGYTVTVLLTGPPTTNFDQLKKLYGGKKIELTRLLPAMRFENSLVAEISYRVMRWIVDESQVRRGPWEMIFMLGGKGVGYYTLLAQRQGLLCIGSHIVVGLDGLSPLRRDQFRKGSKNALVTEEESLAGDFLQQRSTEMADTVIASSKALLDYALESGWRVPEHTYILPYLTVPVANEKSEIERAEELIPARQTQVKEFVFIGPLGTVGGLSVFLNAIDNVLSRDQKAHRKILKERQVKVTFYGWNDVTGDDGDITGEQYIEMRSYAWGNRVKWTVNSELHLKKLVKYMTEPGKGRVAVLPAIGDSSGFVLHQALRAGVPVMASNLKSSQELVHIQDRRDVLFAANDTVALAKRMIDVFNNGGKRSGMPSFNVSSFTWSSPSCH